ncbi:hypothetical protein D5085_01055 [Ectothiorhodospiraceae bacterium BW-2]|nr:hypothetical protein D5085_01055 [Ectothiorhodospiraceae bacterium BW-2]
MIKLLQRFTPPIVHYRIEQYEHDGTLLRLKMVIEMNDNSLLHVKEYRFADGSRKYAYHWLDATGQLRTRWDNAHHWPHIATFPHHQHIERNDNVHPSTATSLEAVLQRIQQQVAS